MKQIVFIVILYVGMVGTMFGQKKAPAISDSGAQVPITYGLVVDNSGSYRSLLDKVIKLVYDIVDENRPGDETFLVTFVDTGKIVLRQDLTEDKDELRDAAENMFIEGGPTAILDAVKYSAGYLLANARSETDRPKVLVLVTDGDERESATPIDEVVKSLKAGGIKVFVLAIADGKVYTKVIDRLSKETGGLKYSPKTRDEITAAVKSLALAIRTK